MFDSKDQRKRNRYGVLFNDVMLLAQKDGNNLHLRIWISLSSRCKVQNTNGENNEPRNISPLAQTGSLTPLGAFHLHTPKRSFLICTRTTTEKTELVRLLMTTDAQPFSEEDEKLYSQLPKLSLRVEGHSPQRKKHSSLRVFSKDRDRTKPSDIAPFPGVRHHTNPFPGIRLHGGAPPSSNSKTHSPR